MWKSSVSTSCELSIPLCPHYSGMKQPKFLFTPSINRGAPKISIIIYTIWLRRLLLYHLNRYGRLGLLLAPSGLLEIFSDRLQFLRNQVNIVQYVVRDCALLRASLLLYQVVDLLQEPTQPSQGQLLAYERVHFFASNISQWLVRTPDKETQQEVLKDLELLLLGKFQKDIMQR